MARYDDFIYSQARRRWLIDNFVPINTVSKSYLEYDPVHVGQHEVYDGSARTSLHPESCRQLRLNILPTILPAPYYFTVKNACVRGFTVADPAHPDRSILETYADVKWYDRDTHWRDKDRAVRRKLVSHCAGRAADLDRAYMFGTRGWDNYYHFLIDTCAKFVEYDENGAIPAGAPLLAPQPLRGFQRAYLSLLGIDEDRIHVTEDRPTKISALLIGAPRRQVYVSSQNAVRALRSRVLQTLNLSHDAGGRKIYISRQSAATRRILNHDALQEVFAEYGVETFAPEGKSVAEQIEIFSQAATIIAPHGAGLANLIYANQPKVIELIPVDRWDYGYFIPLTHAVGGSYTGLVSEPENAQNDFRVDIDRLRAALEEVSSQT